MLNVDNIGRVLPTKPYAEYQAQCKISKRSGYPIKLYFVKNGAYDKTVKSSRYHVFYINISDSEVIEGSLKTANQSISFKSQPGQLVAITPAGSELNYQVYTNFKQAILCVHESVLNDKVVEYSKGEYQLATVAPSGPVDSPLLCSVLKEIEKIQIGEMKQDQLYLESLTDIALVKIINYYTTMRKNTPRYRAHSPANMKKVLDYVFDNLDQEVQVSELAKILGLSQYQFTRVFKEYTGSSPYQYILNLRYEKSKEYLTKSQMSMVSIANSLGFSSQSHFQSFFKKQSGNTPVKYRTIFINLSKISFIAEPYLCIN